MTPTSQALETSGIDRVFHEATQAQPAWARKPVARRLSVLARLRRRICDRADDLVASVDRWKDRRPGETLAAEVLPLAEACRFLQRRAEGILRPRRPGRYALLNVFGRYTLEVRREPFGCVLIIGPSNYPLMLPGLQALYALAAGNAVVIKPGAGGGEACGLLRDMLCECGLPENLCQVLGEDPKQGRDALAAGPDKVVITGSVDTGRKVLEACAPSITPATLELSGCDAVFVLPEADLDLVFRAVRFGLTLNGGATCISPRRLFAMPDTARELSDRLAESCAAEPACRMAPNAAQTVSALIKEALAAGARRVCGHVDDLRGPIVIENASPDMRLLHEDVPAPVLAIVPVRDMGEALRAAERCSYALGATVFGPWKEARAFATRVSAGTVVVNDMIAPTADPRVPFGGWKLSGYGVTRGAEGLLDMTRVKAVIVSRARHRPHLEMPMERAEPIIRALLSARHGAGAVTRLRSWLRALALLRESRRERCGTVRRAAPT